MSRMSRSAPYLRKPIHSRPGESSNKEQGRKIRIEELKQEVQELEQEHKSVLKALKDKYHNSGVKGIPCLRSSRVRSFLLEEREALKEYRKDSTRHIKNVEIQLKKNSDFYEKEISNLQGYVSSLGQKTSSKLVNSDLTSIDQYYDMYVEEKERARTFYKALKNKEAECKDLHKSLEISIGERHLELQNKDKETQILIQEIKILYEQLNQFKGENFQGQIERVAHKIFEYIQFLDNKVQGCEESVQKLNKIIAEFKFNLKFSPKSKSNKTNPHRSSAKNTKNGISKALDYQIADKDLQLIEQEKRVTSENTEIKHELNALYSSLEEKEEEIRKINEKHLQEKCLLKRNLKEIQEKHQTEMINFQKKIEELQDIISKTYEENTSKNKKNIIKYKNKVSELEKDRDTIKTNLNKQIENLVKERTKMLEANHSQLANISSLNTELFNANTKIKQIENDLAETEIELKNRNQECSDLKHQKDILHEEVNALTVHLEKLKTEKQALFDKFTQENRLLTENLIRDKTLQVVKSSKEKDKMIEDIKEGYNEKILYLNEENNLKIEKLTKEHDEHILKLKNTIENLVQNHDIEINSLVKEKDRMMDLLNKEKTFSEENPPQIQTNLTTNKIKMLEKLNEEQRTIIDNLTRQIDERVEFVTREKNDIIENLNKETKKLHEENTAMKESSLLERKHSDEYAAELENKNQILQQTLESLNAKFNKRNKQAIQYKMNLKRLQEESIQELRRQNASIKEDLLSFHVTFEKTNEESEVFKREIDKYKESYNQQLSIIDNLEKEIVKSKNSFELTLEQHKEVVHKLTRDLNESLDEVEKLKDQRSTNDSLMLQKIQVECAEMNSKIIEASEKAARYQKQFLNANEQIEALKNEVSTKESQLKKFNEETDKTVEEYLNLVKELESESMLVKQELNTENSVFKDESLKNAGIENIKDLAEAYSTTIHTNQHLSNQINQLKIQESLTAEKEKSAQLQVAELKSKLQEKDFNFKDKLRSLDSRISYLEQLNNEMAQDYKSREQSKNKELAQSLKEIEHLKSLNYEKKYEELKQIEGELILKLETSEDQIYELETQLGQTKAKLFQEKERNEELEDQIQELMTKRN